MKMRRMWFCLVLLSLCVSAASAQELSADVKAKLDAKFTKYQPLGKDDKVVAAVKDFNATPPESAKTMTQDKWKSLTLLSPEIRALGSNDLVKYLKEKMDPSVSELFISGADGNKVAFFAKTSSWCHKGKGKHDKPMEGETWIGEMEVDESTGKQQIQISFPVVDKDDEDKPIGSIVMGFDVSKL